MDYKFKGQYNSTFGNGKLRACILCLIAIFNIRNEGIAQEQEMNTRQKWLLNAGIVFTKSNVIDKSFSSIPYSGNSLGASFFLKYQKNKGSHELRAYYTRGDLQTAAKVKEELTQTYITADYTNLYTIGSSGLNSFTYKAGAGLNVLYAKRDYRNFINNNESFEFAASAGGAFEVSYFFNNKLAGFSLTDRISLPLVSYIIVPAFGGEDAQGSFDKNNHIAGISSFFRVINFLTLQKELSDRQRLSLSYNWDYWQISLSREVKQANHRLGFTYSFIF